MSALVREMTATIAGLLCAGKGILAADESVATIGKRFDALNVPSTEEVRRDYRALLFATPGLGDFISGAILYKETLVQKTAAGDPLPRLLTAQGIIPGIKVDTGTLPLTGFPGELVTQGLDGLADRLAQYKQLGARFAKWRAVLAIGSGIPTPQAIAVNANALARYAALCQDQGLAPIVEPEVLMDGDHTLATCAAVTEEVLHTVFHALHQQRVALECMLLKPNMVVPGNRCTVQSAPDQVAAATLACLRRTVPAAVPGIVFLSGGQSDVAATANLNAINALAETPPWVLSFSYGRALQAPAIEKWRGEVAKVAVAQQALLKRARLNGAARDGNYTAAMEIE